MITIEVGAVESKLVGEIDELHFAAIREAMSYKDQDAFMKRRALIAKGKKEAARHVPDRLYLMTPKGRTFRTGLLQRMKNQLAMQGLAYQVIDRREPGIPEHPMMLRQEIDFRGYQHTAIKAGVEAMNGLLRMGTGGGKTRVMAGIVTALERRAVILVHRVDLMTQVLDVLRGLMQWPQLVGQVGNGVYEPNVITVCTIQTICAALGMNFEGSEFSDKEKVVGARAHEKQIAAMLRDAQVCVVDEAHHTPARTIGEVLALCVNAAWKIGLTATDWRDDGTDILIEAAMGPRFYDISLSDLMDLGYLVRADVRMEQMAYTGFGIDSKNYQAIYAHFYTQNEDFHKQVLEANANLHDAGKHILTLVTSVQHGDILKRMHNSFGIPTEYLSGRDPSWKREQVFADIRSGKLRHLIGTSIADEGLDLPILDTLHLLNGGKSTTMTTQRTGRVLRPYEGKERALVIDYRCRANAKLDKHAGRRAGVYRTERGFSFKEVR